MLLMLVCIPVGGVLPVLWVGTLVQTWRACGRRRYIGLMCVAGSVVVTCFAAPVVFQFLADLLEGITFILTPM